MYPTDGGGYDGDESLDWLWDLEGYDVGGAGTGLPTGGTAAVPPTTAATAGAAGAAGASGGSGLSGVRKHLRKQPQPSDEFATAAFSLGPPTGPVAVPEFSSAAAVGAAGYASSLEGERTDRGRRSLMVAAALLVVGLGAGVVLAMSGGGKANHVAQAPNAEPPTTTTETTVAAGTTTAPLPSDTTAVPTTAAAAPVDNVAVNPPTGTTIPGYQPPTTRPRFCARLVVFMLPGDPSTTSPTVTRVGPPTTPPPPTTQPTTPPPTNPPTTPPPATVPKPPPTTPATSPPATHPPATNPPATNPPPPATTPCR